LIDDAGDVMVTTTRRLIMLENRSNGSRGVSRRRFLASGGLALAGLALGGRAALAGGGKAAAALRLPRADGAFELAPLPYAHAALQPHIDARTMEIHHGRHHAAYVRNLNDALAKQPALTQHSLPELLADINALPETVRLTIRNNGGGHYNHALFWQTMSPEGGGEPGGELAKAIGAAFGDFAGFKAKFTETAARVFGSGWAWLVARQNGALAIGSTPNQDNPLMTGVSALTGAPILGLDVWEHAYYLHYQNRRADYIQAWWNVVDWTQVGALHAAATG
jgi:Fe-Mn family superoxide dismutase